MLTVNLTTEEAKLITSALTEYNRLFKKFDIENPKTIDVSTSIITKLLQALDDREAKK